MNKIMTRIFTTALLLMSSMGAWADQTINVKVVGNGSVKVEVGSLVETFTSDGNMTVQGDAGQNVTLTLTPGSGSFWKRPTVQSTVLVGTRTPTVSQLVLTGGNGDYNSPTTFSFTMPGAEYSGVSVTVEFTNYKEIYSGSEITDMSGTYYLSDNFTPSDEPIGTAAEPFCGTIDGQLNTFSIGHPLIGYAEGATIRNVILDNVTISGEGTTIDINGGNKTVTGAIANVATGATRIYNCGILATNSSSVSGSDYVGGLVGLLDGEARVINCYSYANITKGSEVGGIVGYNNFASKHNNLKTMVMNCMFYGDITASGIIAPIYGGLEISNDKIANSNNRLNNYNYFLNEASFSENRKITKYNCALAAEERFLVRFEFYRHLLNSTRELAAWYATGSTDDAHSKMAKWVLDKTIAPYPILKVQGKYPSVVNYDPYKTFDAETGKDVDRTSVSADTPNKGRHLGKLSVTIDESNTTDGGQEKPSGALVTTTSLTLNRTDKDFDNYNFNYDKVQLPYYNDVGSGNYTGNRVVTGWKITSMENGTQGTYSETDYDYPNYNYADRDTYAKDLYSVSGRVFAQGAYFNVPTGVTGITIEPYWGKATYLSDAYYDVYGYDSDQLNTIPFPLRYTDNTNYSIAGNDQKVYTSFSNALNNLKDVASPTVYDYAVVLVGNYHKGGDPELSDGAKPFTIMSADLNGDNEPDYCLIFKSAKNKAVSPIRYDFITVPATSMAHKMATSTNLAIPGNCTPKGWFEITTTGLMKFGQFEHSQDSKALSPLIFMGGIIEQFVTNNTNAAYSYGAKTTYMLFGDNVWFKLLSNGTHMDKKRATPHRPISMVGGDYEKVYLSGYFLQDGSKCTNDGGDRNAEGYIDGGRFGEVAGASQEIIDGDVTWVINNADICSFFGGGINDARAITGNISTTIKNSRVDEFYGGPKFGNMVSEKTVTTNATGCTFGKYYGAGYGGTAIARKHLNGSNFTSLNYNWSNWKYYETATNANFRGKLNTGNNGIAVDYEGEFFAGSSGNVARLYGLFASFSTAQTNNVSSTLKNCIVLENFYGGGALGRVTGRATSELDGCEVWGNVFGAGFSAQIPTVTVRNSGWFDQEPFYNTATGVYERILYPATTEYTWVHVNKLDNGSQTLVDDGDTHTIKTTGDLSALGRVGEVDLTIKGNSKVHGSVYGGGDESTTDGNTTVTIKDDSQIYRDVFGGGNQGEVGGSTTVNIK